MPRNTPVWLTATTSFHDSNDVSAIRCPAQDAGVVHQDVEATVVGDDPFDQRVPLLRIGDVVVHEGAADPGGGLLALVDEDVGDEHRGPFFREQRGLGRTLPPCAAGDDRNPTVQLPHHVSPVFMAAAAADDCSLAGFAASSPRARHQP